MSEFAKFSATLGKMTVGDQETKIELIVSMKEVQKNFMFLTNNQKQKVIVSLGDPQMSMTFPEDQEEPYRVYTADQHGVVSVHDEKQQGDLFKPVEEDTQTDPYVGKEIVITHVMGTDAVAYVFPIIDGEATFPKKYVNSMCILNLDVDDVKREIGTAPISETGPTRYLISELLRAFSGELRDILTADGAESSTDPEDEDDLDDWEREIMSESNADQELIEQIDARHNEQPVDAAPVDLDTFILTKKPKFEDIEYDFPTLLQRKKSGDTWMDIAKSLGIPSTQLSSAWSKYKKRVEDMRNGGAA